MIGGVNPLEGGAPPVAVELVHHGVVAVHAVQPGLAALRIVGECFLRQLLEVAVGEEVLFKVVLLWAVPLTCPPSILLVEPLPLLVVSDEVPISESEEEARSLKSEGPDDGCLGGIPLGPGCPCGGKPHRGLEEPRCPSRRKVAARPGSTSTHDRSVIGMNCCRNAFLTDKPGRAGCAVGVEGRGVAS